MSEGLTCEEYSERAIVVRGSTKERKEKLKNLGGRWNPYLKDKHGAQIPGWIFSKRRQKDVIDYVNWINNNLDGFVDCKPMTFRKLNKLLREHVQPAPRSEPVRVVVQEEPKKKNSWWIPVVFSLSALLTAYYCRMYTEIFTKAFWDSCLF